MAQVARISGPLLAANLKRTQANLAFDNDLLYIGHLTGKVGVKKASPGTELDIFGQTYANEFRGDTLTGGNIKFDTNGLSSITGNIILDSLGTIHADEMHTEKLTFNDNYIGSLNNSNIVFDPNGAGVVNFPSTKIGGNVSTTGNITIPGNITVGGTMNFGDAPTDTLDFDFVSLTQDFKPHTTAGAHDLGSASKMWNNVTVGKARIGDIEIDNDFISTTTLNNNLTVRASGTGSIIIGDLDFKGHNISATGSSWNINTATFSGYLLPSNDGNLTNYLASGCSFSPDGTKFFISAEVDQDINVHICATPWDVTSIDPNAVITTFHTGNETEVNGIGHNGLAGHFWKPDGTKLFVSGGYGNSLSSTPKSQFFAYEVSIPWDVTQCQYNGENSFDGITNGDAPNFHMSSDGKHIFWPYGDTLYHYQMSTPWNISTLVSGQSVAISGITGYTGVANTKVVWLNNAGTKMYTIDSSEVMHTFVLSVGHDISTATAPGVTKSIGLQQGGMVGDWDTAMAMTFKPDGSRMYVVGRKTYSPDQQFGSFKQFDLEIARDLIIKPGGGTVSINSTAALRVPDGTEAERTNLNRDVRYNKTTNFFELFSTAYTPLRGIWSENRQTYVLANASNDFSFVTNGVTNTTLSSTSLITNKLISQNTVEIDGNTISSATTNADFNLTATGTVNIANFQFDTNTIHNKIAQAFKISKTGNQGYIHFDAVGGMVVPSGSTAQRPAGVIGQTRFNTQLAYLETYDGTQWANIAGAGGGITESYMEELVNIYTIALA